jgi:hypothetical protein
VAPKSKERVSSIAQWPRENVKRSGSWLVFRRNIWLLMSSLDLYSYKHILLGIWNLSRGFLDEGAK